MTNPRPEREPDHVDLSDVLQHPRIAGHLFYTLPFGLLSQLQREVKLDELDPELHALEFSLSRQMGDHATWVGVWNGSPVRYAGLFALSESILEAVTAAAPMFKDDPAWKDILDRKEEIGKDAQRKLDKFHMDGRGYCGWLLTQPSFLAEHDAFFARWHEHVQHYGLPQPGPLATNSVLQDVSQLDEQTQQYCAEFDEFLSRWCLADLVAPYLPEPQQVQFPVLNGQHATNLLRRGGRLIYMPGIMPIPDRVMLRELMEDAQGRDDQPKHLQEWMQIIKAGNSAKSQVAHFARLFQLQHCWLVLHRRWGERLTGHVERLQYAFAAFLLPNKELANVESIRKDLRFLAERRGGADWYRRPCVLDHF